MGYASGDTEKQKARVEGPGAFLTPGNVLLSHPVARRVGHAREVGRALEGMRDLGRERCRAENVAANCQLPVLDQFLPLCSCTTSTRSPSRGLRKLTRSP